MFDIREDDLSSEPVQALLALHLSGLRAASPPGAVYALDLSGLRGPDVTVWTAWRGDNLAGIAALKLLDSASAEIKSMRTHPDFLRRGAADALLDHIIAIARQRKLRLLSLETGSGDAFAPALALYRKRGFKNGEAFAAYRPSAINQFLHLPL